MITSPMVEVAFLRVLLEVFVAEGTPLEVAYDADDSEAVKRNSGGVIVSSVSAPLIQARMIEPPNIQSGDSVWEIPATAQP